MPKPAQSVKLKEQRILAGPKETSILIHDMLETEVWYQQILSKVAPNGKCKKVGGS